MKIRVRSKTTTKENSEPKIVAEITIELSPADVRDATGSGLANFYQAFGEEIIEAIQNYKPYKRI